MFISLEKNQPQRIDTYGRPITRPEVLAEISRIEALPRKNRTTAECMRLHNLKKDGDFAKNKNKCRHAAPKEPEGTTLAELNTSAADDADNAIAQIREIIEKIYNGTNPIAAIKESQLTPRRFYNYLDGNLKDTELRKAISEIQHKQNPDTDRPEENTEYFRNRVFETLRELKGEFSRARALFAEFCLFRREQLETQLLAGEIDTSTYTTLSTDYKYLAGKFAPAIYGDKITVSSSVTHNVTTAVDTNKVAQLNSLLAGALPAPDEAKIADWEEVDK
jgi:hypothetical protein